jgi:hypothetical protein
VQQVSLFARHFNKSPEVLRVEAMHQNIHQVIRQWVQSPQRVSRPKSAKRQRTDIGGGRRLRHEWHLVSM